MSEMQFSSEGFDLDDLKDANEEVVLELSTTPAEYKARGNSHFQQKDYQKAIEDYSKAIQATPGIKGDEVLRLKEEFDEAQIQKTREQLRIDQNRKKEDTESEKDSGSKQPTPPPPFTFEHPHKDEMSVYYGNRAAAYMALTMWEDALEDCTVALLYQPRYPKVLLRRATLYERNNQTDLALQDAKQALQLDPTNSKYQQTVKRLQKLEDERLEKLKEETMGKLKELGNSILGNFGLSLDNFQATQDPNTGSYSIQYKN